MAAVTKGVVESGRVGALGEQIALAALLRLQEEGSIGGVRRQVPTHSKDKPRVGLYFRTDIEFARLSDNQRFVVWVTQRTSAENSDSYFWGLLNQLTQVWRKHAPHNPICVLLILGSDSYWKSWVFGASALVFDYVFFVGDVSDDIADIMNFRLERAPKLRREIEGNRRLVFRSAVNTHTLLDKYGSDRLAAVSSPEAKDLIGKVSGLIDIQRQTANPLLIDLRASICELIEQHIAHLDVGNLLEEKRSSRYHDDIEVLAAFLIMMLRVEMPHSDLINAICHIYGSKENQVEKQIDKLVKWGYLTRTNDSTLTVNPKFLVALVDHLARSNGRLPSVNELYHHFVFTPILHERMSSNQRSLLKELSRSDRIQDPRALVEYLRAGARTIQALHRVLRWKLKTLTRRKEILDFYLDACLKNGALVLENNRLRPKSEDLENLAKEQVLYYFSIANRSDRNDSNVLYLIDSYRDKRIEKEYTKLTDLASIKDMQKKRQQLSQLLFEKNEDDFHFFAEVGLYSLGVPVNEMQNRVEGARAGTRFFGFIRGSYDLASTQRERFVNEFLVELEKRILLTAKEVSKEILARRREQVRRNVKINPLEERVQLALRSHGILFLGGTETQVDVYLPSVLNEVGLKVLQAPEMRGEDFVIPLKDGKIVTIVCRASPISYEAQRMMGHSLQFMLGWDAENEKFTVSSDIQHIAIVGGGRWDENWISILLSLFDRVYDSEELDDFIRYVESLEPFLPVGSLYSALLAHVEESIKRRTVSASKIHRIISSFRQLE